MYQTKIDNNNNKNNLGKKNLIDNNKVKLNIDNNQTIAKDAFTGFAILLLTCTYYNQSFSSKNKLYKYLYNDWITWLFKILLSISSQLQAVIKQKTLLVIIQFKI